MRGSWKWLVGRCRPLSAGGVTLGMLQGFGLISWASVFTTFLATWLAALIRWLLGGGIDTGAAG